MSAQERKSAEQTVAELITSDPQGAFDKAMKELRSTQERLKSVRQKLDSQPVKFTSTDGMLSITVDAACEVTSIVFNTQKWRRMAPAELGSVLVQAISRAREQGRARLAEAYRPLLPAAFDPAKAISGNFNIDETFEAARQRSEQIFGGAKPAAPQARKG